MNNHPRVKARKSVLMHALALTVAMAWSCMATAQQEFATPEKAAEAFVEALGTKNADQKRLAELLGEDWRASNPRAGSTLPVWPLLASGRPSLTLIGSTRSTARRSRQAAPALAYSGRVASGWQRVILTSMVEYL